MIINTTMTLTKTKYDIIRYEQIRHHKRSYGMIYEQATELVRLRYKMTPERTARKLIETGIKGKRKRRRTRRCSMERTGARGNEQNILSRGQTPGRSG